MTLPACSVGLIAPVSAIITCTAAAECPNDLVCVVDVGRCTSPGTACVEQRDGTYYAAPDGNACSSKGNDGGVCKSGVCTFCGNRAIEAGEACDDSNTDEQDGCTSQCLIAVCGDGVTTPLAETCDDGNTNDNDACAQCKAVSWQAEVAFGLGPRRAGLLSTTLPTMSALTVSRYGKMYVANNDPASANIGFFGGDSPGSVWLVSESADALVRIAGTGNAPQGPHPETSLALSEDFGPIAGLVTDAQGTLYLSEGGIAHKQIVSVTQDGVLHIIAGAGQGCIPNDPNDPSCGDNGLARVAKLFGPGPLAIDQRGNLYFADGNSIRYVDGNGFIKRAAGTGVACSSAKACNIDSPAASTFGTIAGMTFSSANELYVTDTFGTDAPGRIVRIADNTVTVVTDTVENPGAIAALPDDTLAVIDRTDGIDKVVSVPAKTTLTGGSICADPRCGDGGPAEKAGAQSLQSLAVDPVGRTVVVDSGLNAIRRIDASGSIQRVLGSYQVTRTFTGARGTGTTIAPRAVATNNTGDIIVSSSKQVFVWRNVTQLVELIAGYICDTCAFEGAFDEVQFGRIDDVAIDGDAIYVLDSSVKNPAVKQIKKIAAGNVSVLAGAPLACEANCEGSSGTVADAKNLTFDQPLAISASPGFVWVTTRLSVWRIDTATREAVRYAGGQAGRDTGPVAATAAQFGCPYDLAVSGSDVFVADTYNCVVRRIRDGEVTTFRDLGAATCVSGAPATCVLPNVVCGDAGYPVSAAVDDASLYFAEESCGKVYKAGLAESTSSVIAGNGPDAIDGQEAVNALLSKPRVATAPGGRVLVFSASSGVESGRVRAIDSGMIRTLVGNVDRTSSGPFARSEIGAAGQAVGFGSNAALIVDAAQNVLRRVRFDTASLDPILGYTPGIELPSLGVNGTAPARYVETAARSRGVAFDPLKQTIYFSTTYGIAKIVVGVTSDGTDWTTSYLPFEGRGNIAGASFEALALDANGQKLYAVDNVRSVVQEVELGTGSVTTIAGKADFIGFNGDGGPAVDATLDAPQSIVIADSGAIYIADQNNNRVRRISSDGIIDTVLGTGIASSVGTDGIARELPVDRPVGLAFDAFGNLVVAGRGTVRVVLKSGSDETRDPDGDSLVTNIYDVTNYPEQADLVSCLKAPFRGPAPDVLFVADACTGAVIKLQRQ
ncbi:MAG: hypothetical protein H7Z43_08555 [Clostridia bacterium]|nr:hypothetical protein [Deltaproteobacteria bacterium]